MLVKDSITPRHIEGFLKLLGELSIGELELDSYVRFYLAHLITHKKYFLHIYASVLNEILNKINKPKEQIALVDYGAGNGLLGLFAKYCGFSNVVIIDISPEFNYSQKMLSKKINILADDILCGDVDFLKEKITVPPDAIVGTDVIEHIYDLNFFFSTLRALNEKMMLIFTTASNEKNWLKKKWLVRLQKIDEWKGWKQSEHNETIPSFRKIREIIIKDTLPSIDSTSLQVLVNNTRGLRKDDIVRECKTYAQQGLVPPSPRHPTNTCDPLTGSWTERILTYDEYKNLYDKHGFSLQIKNGFYNGYQQNLKGWVFRQLNTLIRKTGKTGHFFSPYIVLIGLPKQDETNEGLLQVDC